MSTQAARQLWTHLSVSDDLPATRAELRPLFEEWRDKQWHGANVSFSEVLFHLARDVKVVRVKNSEQLHWKGAPKPAAPQEQPPQPRPQRKARPLKLHARAIFHGWSSELAWARVLYKPKKDHIVFLHMWKQQKRGDDESGAWVNPRFPPDSVKRLLDYARRMYEEGYPKGDGGEKERGKLKGHARRHCEMCIELGAPCNGAASDSEED